MGFMILDLETENHELHGDKASPRHPENYIVAPAFAIDDGPVQDWYFTSREEADASDWFKVPDDVDFIVAHNAMFEADWLLHRHREEFEKFLRRGGRLICTQLAEYLLSHQTELYPALNEVAPRYGGTEKIDAVKLMWERGYLTSQIDKSLLLEYLSGPGGDIENTRRVCFGQIPKLQEQGMWDMYLIRCDALLFSAYSKFFGMKVDEAAASMGRDKITARVAELEAELLKFLPNDLPDAEQFNWGSDFHLSALLFGGPIKFKVKVSYDPPKYEKVECYQTLDGQYIVTGAETALDELVTFKAGKNKGSPKTFSVDSTTEKLKWGEVVYDFPGIVAFDELPGDVAREYTDKRGQFRGKRYLSDRVEVWNDDKTKLLRVEAEGTPVYSTSGDSLELLTEHSACPIFGMLKELADNHKILGTYFNGLLTKTVDGFLHMSLNHTATVTGRLSSALQQMPRVERVENAAGEKVETVGSAVKRAFISRFEKRGRIIGVDYTALEVVHLAALSGDKNLLKYLQEGTDMHILRLASKLHRPYDELLAIKNDKGHPEHEDIVNQRQAQKPMSFQFQYGGTAKGMAFKIKGLTEEDAQAFIDNEFKILPESSNYRYVIEDEVCERAAKLPNCREQRDDGSWGLYKRSYFVAPSGTRYSFRQHPKVMWEGGRKQTIMQFKISQLANYPCQGEAGLVTQTATALVIRWLIENRFFDDLVFPINTVHDALYLDSIDELAEMVAHAIEELMEYSPKYMAELFEGYACLNEIPYPAVAELGLNMADQEHLH